MGGYRVPNPGGTRGSGRPPAREEAKRLPDPRPVEYFINDRYNTKLVDERAEEVARQLAKVTATQMRRFYGDVMTLRRRLDLEAGEGGEAAREKVFERLRSDFKLLKAKAVYACNREGNRLPEEFLRFFLDHVKAVQNLRDFEAFCRHFEAVVAFHKFYEDRR